MQSNPDYVRLIQAERWEACLPQTMLPNAALPILKNQQRSLKAFQAA